jgi:hypothetical protein
MPVHKADKAAEELAGYHTEFAAIRRDMQQGFAKADQEFAKVRGDINLLRWLAGSNLVLTVLILGSVFALRSKVGEITGQLAQIAHAVSH